MYTAFVRFADYYQHRITTIRRSFDTRAQACTWLAVALAQAGTTDIDFGVSPESHPSRLLELLAELDAERQAAERAAIEAALAAHVAYHRPWTRGPGALVTR